MNPRMMDFWLAQLQNPAPQTMGAQQPMMQQPHMPAQQQQETTSPLQRGAMQGMQAARESMALDETQRNRAFGRGLMEFAGNFNRPAHGPGIEGALGAINQALVPGVRAYADAQDREREFNAALLKREDTLAREAREEARMEKHYQQQEALRRDQMSETAAYRNAMLDLKRDQIAAKRGVEAPQYTEEGIDISGYAPIADKGTLNRYNKEKQGTAKVLKQLKEIKNLDEEYQKLTEGSLINPSNPYIGKYATKAKDVLGYAFPGIADTPSQLRKETVLRQRINSKLEAFTLHAEKEMKGGVLGPGIIKRFKEMGIFPTLEEPADIRNKKISDMEKELEDLHGAASSSIKYKRQIDPLDYSEMQQLFKGKDEPKKEVAAQDERAALRAEEAELLRKAGGR